MKHLNPLQNSPCARMKMRRGDVAASQVAAAPQTCVKETSQQLVAQTGHEMEREGGLLMETSCQDELCSSPEGFPPLPPAPTLPSSCQLSPRSDSSSFLPFPSFCPSNLLHSTLPTPPASDPEPDPRPSSSLSPSYFSMSPPDLLSPPLSTTSHHSDSCSSPASSLPLQTSHPQFNCSCSASEEPQYMQSSFAKQTNEQSNQSNQGEYGTIIGPSVKSEPGCRCVNNLNFTHTGPHLNSSSYDNLQPATGENNQTKYARVGCDEGTKTREVAGEGEEEGKEGKSGSHASPLPSDIPTLESLAQSSPKLSTWRQTRIISEKLEQVVQRFHLN